MSICADCSTPIPEEHADFFVIHEDRGTLRCAKCHHSRDEWSDLTLPGWLVAEIACLLNLADGLMDLTRRISKEIGCECNKEIKDEQGRRIDVIELCIYCHGKDVERRARDVTSWLEQARAPR